METEDDDLYEVYDFLNDKFFDYELPDIKLVYTTDELNGFAVTVIDTKNVEPVKIKLSDITQSMNEKYFYSVLLHEMAHVQTIMDLNGDKLALKDYLRQGGHTDEWHEIVDRLNSIKSKSGKQLFYIVQDIDEDMYNRYLSDD